MSGEYRQYLPDLSIPRFTIMQQQDAHVYAEAFKKGGIPPWLHGLYMHWLELLKDHLGDFDVCNRRAGNVLTLQAEHHVGRRQRGAVPERHAVAQRDDQ